MSTKPFLATWEIEDSDVRIDINRNGFGSILVDGVDVTARVVNVSLDASPGYVRLRVTVLEPSLDPLKAAP